MLIVLLVNLYDTCLIYYQEKILTLTLTRGGNVKLALAIFGNFYAN